MCTLWRAPHVACHSVHGWEERTHGFPHGPATGPQSRIPKADAYQNHQFRKAVQIRHHNPSVGNAVRRPVRVGSDRLGSSECRSELSQNRIGKSEHCPNIVIGLSEGFLSRSERQVPNRISDRNRNEALSVQLCCTAWYS